MNCKIVDQRLVLEKNFLGFLNTNPKISFRAEFIDSFTISAHEAIYVNLVSLFILTVLNTLYFEFPHER